MSYDNLSSVSQNVLKFYQQLTPKCGGVKPVNGDPNPPLLKTYLSGIQKSLSIRILCHVVFFSFKTFFVSDMVHSQHCSK
jgi:hypothetical protein